MTMTAVCDECGRPVVRANTLGGLVVDLEPKVAPDGTVDVTEGGLARVLDPESAAEVRDERRTGLWKIHDH